MTLVASVLPADFAELGHQVQLLEKAGVDRIQWDVMDGRFVPNLTFGPDVIASCRDRVMLGFEAHLMVEDPDPMLPRWVDAGCELVIVHAEATRHLHRTLGRIRQLGARAGVALNPATPLASVEHVLDLADLLLEVDGGIGPGTIGHAARAGATVFCVGSALFAEGPAGLPGRVAALRAEATDERRNP